MEFDEEEEEEPELDLDELDFWEEEKLAHPKVEVDQ